MSKQVAATFAAFKALPNLANKFTASATAGRVLFSPATKMGKTQLRVVATHVDQDNNKLHVATRVNSEATAPSFKEFVRKESANTNLATEIFDLNAEDKEEETKRLMNSMEEQAKEKIG